MAIMNRMRQNTKIILMILVFAFILTIIFSWGMGGFKGRQAKGVIAKVNGDEITAKEYYDSYQQRIEQYRQERGTEPQGRVLDQLQEQVFDAMVQQRLLVDVIEKMGITVTNEELGEELWTNPPQFLRQNPSFQDSTGVFDIEIYKAALQEPQADRFWNSVIMYLKNTLPVQKFVDLMEASAVVVTEQDVILEYKMNNMQATADYLFYNAFAFSDEIKEPAEEEIQDYYKKHREDYRVEEKRVLNVVKMDIKPTPADSAAVYKDAKDLIQDIEQGREFAALAEIYSKDPGSAQNGGDLGYFSRSQMVTPFSDAAFNAGIGEVVGPVETRFGLHIIKVEDKRTRNGETEVKARHILLNFEPSSSTRDDMREEMMYVSEMAQEDSLSNVAEKEGFSLETTPPFTRDGSIPGIGLESQINRFAFRAEVGDVSGLISTEETFYVVELANIQEEHVQPLDEVKSRIVNSLKAEMRMQAAREHCEAAYERLNQGASFEDVAAADSLEIDQTKAFNMTNPIPGIGREPAFAGTAFGLQVGEFSAPVKGTRGYYLLQLIEKDEFNEKVFNASKSQLVYQIQQRRRNQIFADWYQNLKEHANIQDFRDDMM